MKRHGLLVLVVGGIGLQSGWGPVSAQSGPSLGMAQSFAILGGSSVTVASTGSAITGDVGVSPGTSITGFPAGGVVVPPFGIHANDFAAIDAQTSATALYILLQNTGGATPLGPELGATSVGPGVYSFSSTANIAAGTVFTLSGPGPYIFKVGTSVTANVGSSMALLAGASPCNVFWQVTNAATINGAEFAGTIVAQDAVTVGSGGRLDGRALTTALGSVTLAGGNVIGGCSAPANGCPTITLSPSSLPNGRVSSAYTQAIVGSGGTGPYTFAVTGGALPAGLVLSAPGIVSGTPTSPGPATFTITGTDANGCAASVPYTIAVAAACPAITLAPATLPIGTVGAAYSQQITASGGAGSPVFTVVTGTLPAGLSLSAAGLLSGTPTTSGSSAVSIQAVDGVGCPGIAAYTVTITTAVPTLPQVFVLLLALGLTGVGYVQLRRRVRG